MATARWASRPVAKFNCSHAMERTSQIASSLLRRRSKCSPTMRSSTARSSRSTPMARPSFNVLQNQRSRAPELQISAFEVLTHRGRDPTHHPLEKRREILRTQIIPRLPDSIRLSETLEAPVTELMGAVREQGFEGIVAKRRDSHEPGKRSGAWQKMRILQSRDPMIGGYSPGGRGFDAILLGYYEEHEADVGREGSSGLHSASRNAIFKLFHGLEVETCPFKNSLRGAEVSGEKASWRKIC
jgi:ATP-dependent DNA ligase